MTPDELTATWPLADTELRDELVVAYGDEGRGYHDLRHLAEVLYRLGELREAGADFDHVAVILAAWFHDGVYDGQPEAEARSARWAEQALPRVGVDDATVAEVSRLVAMTEHHRPADGDENGAALSDADLGILAAPAERYAEYTADVRREYSHVTDSAFRAGRAAILRDLAAKPRLFNTAQARARWEAAARDNLAREIAELESPLT